MNDNSVKRFKTALVGGFDRRDVIDYIKTLAAERNSLLDAEKKHAEQIARLTAECDELRAELTDTASECEAHSLALEAATRDSEHAASQAAEAVAAAKAECDAELTRLRTESALELAKLRTEINIERQKLTTETAAERQKLDADTVAEREKLRAEYEARTEKLDADTAATLRDAEKRIADASAAAEKARRELNDFKITAVQTAVEKLRACEEQYFEIGDELRRLREKMEEPKPR